MSTITSVAVHKQIPHSVIIEALLQLLCKQYESDEDIQERLLQSVVQQFESWNIISPSLKYSKSRKLYAAGLESLIRKLHFGTKQFMLHGVVLDKNKLQCIDELSPKVQMNLSNDLLMQAKRFSCDFEKTGWLGQGGFGTVLKARHRLDGTEYAIKIIEIKCTGSAGILRVLKEVQLLASLSHPNIISYKSAWLEEWESGHEIHAAKKSYSASTWGEDQSNITNDDCSSSVIFEGPNSCPSNVESSGKTEKKSELQSKKGIFNIVPYLIDKVLLYLQMELCPLTLRNWLNNRNFEKLNKSSNEYFGLDYETLRNIAKQIAKALSHIHAHSIVHRDVKPSNIFINSNTGQVKLGDFGLAKVIHVNNTDGVFTDMVGCGDATSHVGTKTYAAPEQIKGSECTPKSDMFSYGIVLFELYHPFNTIMEMDKAITAVRNGELPSEFCEVWTEQALLIKKLVSHNPEDRPSSENVVNLIKESCKRTREMELMDKLRKATMLLQKTKDELSKCKEYIKHLENKLDDTSQNLILK